MRLADVLVDLPRPAKRVIALGIDVMLCVFAVWLAFALRLDYWGWPPGRPWLAIAGSVAIALPIFVVSGFYRAIFRYAGMGVMLTMAQALALYTVLYASVFTLVGFAGVPRTVGLIQPVLLGVLVGASRLAVRYWLGGLYWQRLGLNVPMRAVIYGAGAAGRQLAAALTSSADMRAVAYIDDNAALQGNTINGLPVLSVQMLSDRISRLGITDVLLAMPSVGRQRRAEIIAQLTHLPLHVRTLPAFDDLAQGRITASDIRDLDIEDLLGRDPVAPDPQLMSQDIRDRVVLVTGAGGSIGSELCRQILRQQPHTLILLDHSEYALYSITQELQTLQAVVSPTTALVSRLASVTDATRLQRLMARFEPHTVFHAAAYKHVPLVEDNPAEGLRNNVLGTQIVARAAMAQGAQRFVLISTDKAVRPTNVMGASKRLAELVLQDLAARSDHGTCFSMVRFGNVLGSSGSVVPLFRQQIRAGGPITLTHPEVTRYFMTIPEAAQLVIQAGAMARGGEVFVLDMGEPVRIADLARRMVELSGLSVRNEQNPSGDIAIEVTGLRPGEKLFEELLIGDHPRPTLHPRVMQAQEERLNPKDLAALLAELEIAVVNDTPQTIRQRLLELGVLKAAIDGMPVL